MYKSFIRPALFLVSPEKIHSLIAATLKILHRFFLIRWIIRSMYQQNDPRLIKKVFGLTFKNPIGLAAGFDKDAELIDALDDFGFGFIEIGTITPKDQPGNPKPRLFRLKSDKALINRMGFNNKGVDKAIRRLQHRKSNILVGGNIGKNKITPNENALDDYSFCLNRLYPFVDYFVVNVSSPNTPDLRALQAKEPLTRLLEGLKNEINSKKVKKPLLLKIAPDLSISELNDIIDIVNILRLDGIIATNTTVDRSGLKSPQSMIEKIGNGGLSGKPLSKRSTEIIRYLKEKLSADIPIIGVGGIMSAEDALEKINAGASLVQVYTGFIYEGPGLIKQINREIINQM